LVKLACELPDDARRSLSLWTCAELARALVAADVVDTISAQSVQRVLESHQLKPWRVHFWLSPKAPRDEAFRATVLELQELYTRLLGPHERVLSLDEKTSLQPRTRTVPTRPAQPGLIPVHLEHEYARKGALQLFAAFDTRTGEVTGILRRRKRQAEFIELLEKIDRETPEAVTLIHLICDNLSVHKGKLVRAWLEKHARFQMHFTPVHCSWMNGSGSHPDHAATRMLALAGRSVKSMASVQRSLRRRARRCRTCSPVLVFQREPGRFMRTPTRLLHVASTFPLPMGSCLRRAVA
jgi:hypothetical protein